MSNTDDFRSLVRQGQKRADQEKLQRLLLEGLQSGKPKVVKDLDVYFERKKRALLNHLNRAE